jgi:hypothetical protein
VGAAAILCAFCASCRAPTQAGPATTPPWLASEEFFPILPWELGKQDKLGDPRQGIQTLADCGFTTVAFVRPKQLAICDRLGMKAIVCPEKWQIKWRELSDQQIFDTVQNLVRECGDSPAVIGFFLKDEPGVGDFPALGKAVAAVKKLAPGKLAYINLFPDYATLGAPDLSQLGTESYSEYLEQYIKQVQPQFISYDNYQVQYSGDLKDPKRVSSYYRNLLDVRRIAQKYDLPFWNIVSSNQIRPTTTVPSPANLLLQAYTTLAAGGKGLTWYTYYEKGYHYGPIDNAGNRGPTWSYLKMVNDQVKVIGPRMARLTSTGVYFSSPPVEGLPNLPGDVISRVTGPTPMMLGEFRDANGEKWVMVVNLSLEESAKFTLTALQSQTRISAISPVDGSVSAIDPDNSMWLPAGQGVLLKFSPPSSTKMSD